MAKQRKSDNTMVWWGVAIGALVLGYMWFKQQLDLIQVGNVSVPFQQLNGTTIRLGINVPIINASALAARITGFAGFILTPQGSTLSTVFLSRPGVIRRFEQADLSFISDVDAISLGTEIFNVIKAGGKPDLKGYRLKGQLLVYGFPVPIDTQLF